MLAQLQDAFSRLHERLTRISPASLIFHWLGCWIVGTPEELKQAPGFWLDDEDRPLPKTEEYSNPKVQMSQVAGEHFRRQLRRDLAIYTAAIAFGLSAVIFLGAKAAIWAVTPGSNDEKPEMLAPAAMVSELKEPSSMTCNEATAMRGNLEMRFDDLKANFDHIGKEAQDAITYTIENCGGDPL